jgi:hypothetical protein
MIIWDCDRIRARHRDIIVNSGAWGLVSFRKIGPLPRVEVLLLILLLFRSAR